MPMLVFRPLAVVLLSVCAVSFVAGCGGASTEHGTISRMSAVDTETMTLCEHEVPAEVCTRCNPELEESFREIGDWCGPHDVPESQCHRCHPDLEFFALPPLAENADYAELSDEEALAGLEPHLSAGKITIVDFYAPWCAPCQNLEVRLRELNNAHEDIAVRKVTVMAWEGPIVDRYLSDVPQLPHVRIYDTDGELAGTLSGFDLDELDALVDEVRAR